MIVEIEEARKKVVKKKILAYIIIGIIDLGTILLLLKYQKEPSNITSDLWIIAVITSIGFLIMFIATRNDKQKFINAYKKNIVEHTLNEILTDVTLDTKYETNNNDQETAVLNAKIIDLGDFFYSNDYVTGKYKNIPFQRTDIKITTQTSESSITKFEGQWYIISFNQPFKTNFKIKDKNFKYDQGMRKLNENSYQKIEIQDEEFNKYFICHAQNSITAIDILTKTLMERIKKIKNETNKTLLFSFMDNKLHIGIETKKDLYEPNLYKKIDFEKEREKVIKELQPIIEFIDGLDLDNNLFQNNTQMQ